MMDFNPNAEPRFRSLERRQTSSSAILETIQKIHLLHSSAIGHDFVWNDFMIPYCRQQLPYDENGSLEYTTNFIAEQKKFLSKTSLESMGNILTRTSNEGGPPHIQAESISDAIPIGELLGRGRWGEVFEVKLQPEKNKLERFALKRMRKPAPREGDGLPRCTVLEFENEVRNLSKCRHDHIIDLRATFTDEVNFGLIVTPVADFTLERLLKDYTTENKISEDRTVQNALENAFGCLLDAVHYLHETLKIRHRDLKPRNILMRNYKVLICDLGSAYDFEPRDREESTESRRPPGTGKYKAPEVWASINPDASQSHNKMADIFSLGCVFLEMHTVLCGEETLDQMAKFITEDNKNDFQGSMKDWAYALSLDRVYLWLKEIYDESQNTGRTDLIRSMLCRERAERSSAQRLVHEVRTMYMSYIGRCCKLPSKGPQPNDLEPPSSLRYPMQSFRIRLLKESDQESQEPTYPADYQQIRDLDVQANPGPDAWATTRSVTFQLSDPLRSFREHWLPAYFVSLTRREKHITLDWSDCNQLRNKWHNQHVVCDKVHYRDSSQNNLQMDVIFESEQDAVDFSTKILQDPINGPLPFKVSLLDKKILTVREYEWKLESTDKQGLGSHVVCLQQSMKSGSPSRLEPLFVPNTLDFVMPLGTNKTYTQFVFTSYSFWVPKYRSDQEEMYELSKEKANFRSVELVPSDKKCTICFEEAPEIMDSTVQGTEVDHPEIPMFCNEDLQKLLDTLTGWTLLVVFSATDIRRQKRGMRSPRLAAADVLCFRKRQQRRIAIRRKDAENESTIDWTTALLAKVDVDTKKQELYFEFASAQTGSKLCLASITTTDDKARAGTQKSETKQSGAKKETWIITVASDSGKLHNIIHEKNLR